MEIEVVKITGTDLKKAFAIRQKVFVEEQQVDPAEEYDEFEETSVHFLALVDGKPAGTARWRFIGTKIKLERFAVLSEYRGSGVGAALVKAVLADISENTETYLHAQIQVVSFYKKFGFKAVGNEFVEANIRHYKMVLTT